MLYTKSEYLSDLEAIGEIDSKTNKKDKLYWIEQYNLWAAGERGELVNELASTLMSNFDSFQSNGLNTVETIQGGFNADGMH